MLFSSLVFLWFFLPCSRFSLLSGSRTERKKYCPFRGQPHLLWMGRTALSAFSAADRALMLRCRALSRRCRGADRAKEAVGGGFYRLPLESSGILSMITSLRRQPAVLREKSCSLCATSFFRLESHFTPSRQSPMLWMSTAEKALHRKTCSTWLSTSFYSRRFFPDRL